jgi:hypothetical protein
MDLRVIYVYDDEADAWGFRVPRLGIVRCWRRAMRFRCPLFE